MLLLLMICFPQKHTLLLRKAPSSLHLMRKLPPSHFLQAASFPPEEEREPFFVNLYLLGRNSYDERILIQTKNRTIKGEKKIAYLSEASRQNAQLSECIHFIVPLEKLLLSLVIPSNLSMSSWKGINQLSLSF